MTYVSYSDFAVTLSAVVMVQYLVLLLIALRRAGFNDRRAYVRQESVAAHARFVEGPVITVGLFFALFTAAAAIVIGRPEYARIAGLAVASIRGGLFVLGCWLLLWYWHQRATWWRHRE